MTSSRDMVRRARRELGRAMDPVPRRHLAVVTCMDARVDPWRIFNADLGDIQVVRNAGGIVTDDVLRSLTVATTVLQVRTVELLMHTDCGMHGLDEAAVAAAARERTGAEPTGPLLAFADLEAELRRGVEALRSHPVVGPSTTVRGGIYDVVAGTRRTVVR